MNIKSMTGFAQGQAKIPAGRIVWELRSVNHRYLEIGLRLPDECRILEPVVRERLRTTLGRGKVEAQLQLRADPDDRPGLTIDQTLLTRILTALTEIEAQLPQAAPVNAMEVLRWPGMVTTAMWDMGIHRDLILDLLDQTMADLVRQRAAEGERLQAALSDRCQEIVAIVAEVRERQPPQLVAQRNKLLARLAELGPPLAEGRLEQELVFWAQKIDIDEELTRLDSHIAALNAALREDKPVGRRLDFLMQEFQREANTLGAKAADAKTSAAVVTMKVLIEQMREQIQNIE